MFYFILHADEDFKTFLSVKWIFIYYTWKDIYFKTITIQVQINKDSSKTYALKQLKKHHIVETRQIEHIMNEKRIMMDSRCEFIVR